MAQSRPYPRLIAAVLALVLLSLTSGCVYLRLLALKNQLNEFDKNFAVTAVDGVRIECKDPVLFGDDLRWLGVEPLTIRAVGESEHWHVRWVKEPPEGVAEPLEYDVQLNAELTERRVSAVQIPERYFEYFPKELFVQLLRSTAGAKIDKSARQAEVTTAAEPSAAAAQPPRLAAIEQMLGLPTERSDDAEYSHRMYRYRPQSRGKKGKPIEVTFSFEHGTGELRKLIGKLPKGTVTFSFAPHPSS